MFRLDKLLYIKTTHFNHIYTNYIYSLCFAGTTKEIRITLGLESDNVFCLDNKYVQICQRKSYLQTQTGQIVCF